MLPVQTGARPSNLCKQLTDDNTALYYIESLAETCGRLDTVGQSCSAMQSAHRDESLLSDLAANVQMSYESVSFPERQRKMQYFAEDLHWNPMALESHFVGGALQGASVEGPVQASRAICV